MFDSLVRIYTDDNLLRKIRAREINGPCGVCEFNDMCGGSKARACSYSGDPLSSDPSARVAQSFHDIRDDYGRERVIVETFCLPPIYAMLF